MGDLDEDRMCLPSPGGGGSARVRTEAIGNATPSMIYRASARLYPARLPALVYPDHWQIRMVRQNGEIRWRGNHIFIGEVLAGEPVGLRESSDDGAWRLHFGPILLGTINHAGQFLRAGDRRRRRVALRSPKASRDAPAD